jgi:hypothetical protein
MHNAGSSVITVNGAVATVIIQFIITCGMFFDYIHITVNTKKRTNVSCLNSLTYFKMKHKVNINMPRCL